MAAGDTSLVYRTSMAFDVTNLHSQPTSADWTTGWTSDAYDNSTNKDLDVLISAQFTVAAASVVAGQIRVYLLPLLHNVGGSDTWPDVYTTGTEGTQSASAVVRDTEILDSAFTLLWGTTTDTGNSDVYPMPPVSVMGRLGYVPLKFLIFVAHSTGQNLAASGNGVWARGVYANVAQS